MKEELGILKEKSVILYSGNIGKKQGLSTMIDVAIKIQDQEELLFVICGDGIEKPRIEKLALNSSNVKMIPLQPADRLNDLLNIADIHLLLQKEGVEDLVMPSKLLGMLASGSPVIATTKIKSELGQIIIDIGIVACPGDVDEIADKIMMLISDKDLSKDLGKRGRDWVEKSRSNSIILNEFNVELLSLLSEDDNKKQDK